MRVCVCVCVRACVCACVRMERYTTEHAAVVASPAYLRFSVFEKNQHAFAVCSSAAFSKPIGCHGEVPDTAAHLHIGTTRELTVQPPQSSLLSGVLHVYPTLGRRQHATSSWQGQIADST